MWEEVCLFERSMDRKKIPITLVSIYSSTIHSKKQILWEEFIRMKGNYNNTIWCMIGDFNVVRKPRERND